MVEDVAMEEVVAMVEDVYLEDEMAEEAVFTFCFLISGEIAEGSLPTLRFLEGGEISRP